MYIQLYKIMSLVFLSLPLFPLLLSFSFFLLTYFFFLLADDGAVLVQAAICGPLDVSKQIAVDQLLALRLQDMVGCPVIMGIGIDRIDSPFPRQPISAAGSSSAGLATYSGGRRGTAAQKQLALDPPVRPAAGRALSHSH